MDNHSLATDVDTADGVISTQTRAAQKHLQNKVRDILEKFGPGPRIHYHMGIYDISLDYDTTTDIGRIQRRIVDAAEVMVTRAAEIWEASKTLAGNIIDVGCGLGGGSIYWAENFGAQVHAVTNVRSHVQLIEQFAAEADVSDRIHVLLTDAAEIPEDLVADAAVAMESLIYMPRDLVLARLARCIRPGGWLCVEDAFVLRTQWRQAWDDHYRTQIGKAEEFISLANKLGFTLDRNEDITGETTEFWVQSMAWLDAKISTTIPGAEEYNLLLNRLRWHANFFRAWRDEAFEVRVLRFQKRNYA